MKGSAPNAPDTGSQFEDVRNGHTPRLRQASLDVVMSSNTTRPATSSTRQPKPETRTPQTRSPRKRDRVRVGLTTPVATASLLCKADRLAFDLKRLHRLRYLRHDRLRQRCVVERLCERLALVRRPPEELHEGFT